MSTVTYKKTLKNGGQVEYKYVQFRLDADCPEAVFAQKKMTKLGMDANDWLKYIVRKMMEE